MSTQSQLSLLRSLATNGASDNNITPEQALAKNQLTKAKEIVSQIPKELSPSQKFTMFEEQTRDWIPHPDNTEEFWSIKEELYPNNSFRKDSIDNVYEDISGFSSDVEYNQYFSNKMHTWPSWIQDEFRPVADKYRAMGEQKDLEHARIGNKLDVEKRLDSLVKKERFGLAPNISLRAHAMDYYTAMKYNYHEEIDVKGGRLSVPRDGELVPIYALPAEEYPPVDPSEEYILMNDTFKMIQSAFKPYYDKAVSGMKKETKSVSKDLFNSIKGLGSNYKEHHYNIILDYAMQEKDPIAVTREGVIDIISNNYNNGHYSSDAEAFLDYRMMMVNLMSTLKRRLDQ